MHTKSELLSMPEQQLREIITKGKYDLSDLRYDSDRIKSAIPKKDLVDVIFANQVPPPSKAGITHYARILKFNGERMSGSKGALNFIKQVYPKMTEERANAFVSDIQKL